MNRKICISSLVIVAFFSVQLILPIQLAKAETPDPMKECGIGALTDFVAGGVGKLIGQGLDYLGQAAKGIPVIGDAIGSILGGGEDPVKDEETRSNTAVLSVKNCIQALTDAAFKVALAKLKKRLLDRITDDTIAWINDGAKGKPRFIDNFGDVLKESANEAIGDTAREIGLGNLCDEKLSLKLQLNLRKPETKQFREDASCTLDKIVDNVSAFGQDFRNGGWVGYTETLAPNNNRFGLEILALDNVLFAQTQKDQETQLQASSGGGFKGVYACSEWEVIYQNDNTKGKVAILKDIYAYGDEEFDLLRDPDKQLTDTELNSIFGNDLPGSTPLSARCSKKEITLPSILVKGQAEQALESDKDVVVNADDLSPYISAIFDAAINRLIKSGLEGIGIGSGGGGSTSAIFTNSGTGRQPETYGTSTRDTNYKDYGQEYQNATDMKAKLRNSITADTNELRVKFNELDQTLPGYIQSILGVKTELEYLTQCEIQKSDNTITLPIIGIRHLPCASTKQTYDAVVGMYNGAIEFQKLIGELKTQLNSQQDLTTLNETQLIVLGSQISSGLEKIKTTSIQLPKTIAELQKISQTSIEYRTECLKPTPQTYACPSAFE